MKADDGDRESGTRQTYSDSESTLGIERSTFEYGPEPWKDPAVLEELYWERRLSQEQIGDHFDISQQAVSYWFETLEIDARPPMNERDPSISRTVREDGKIQYKVPDDEIENGRVNFYRHQLVALLATDPSEEWAYEPTDILGKDSPLVVHHEMNSPVGVDIPVNLSGLTPRMHVDTHAGGGGASHVEAVLDEIFDDYDGEPDPDDVLDTESWGRRKQIAKLRKWNSRIDSGTAIAGD